MMITKITDEIKGEKTTVNGAEINIPARPATYKVENTKEATTITGQKVEIIDEQKVEFVTVELLEAQRKQVQDKLDEIDAKLESINNIK